MPIHSLDTEISNVKSDLRSSLERISYEFDKLEKEVGNSRASSLLSRAEDERGRINRAADMLCEIKNDIYDLERRVRDISSGSDDIRRDLSEYGF